MTEMNEPIGMPEPPPPAKKATPWKVIIPVAIVVILCCICLVVVGVLYYMGTQGNGPLATLVTTTGTTDITGTWDLYYDWGCDGVYSGPAELNFHADNNFTLTEYSDSLFGTWTIAGTRVEGIFDDYPNSHYTGTLDSTGDYIDGTMDNLDNMTGCWYAER